MTDSYLADSERAPGRAPRVPLDRVPQHARALVHLRERPCLLLPATLDASRHPHRGHGPAPADPPRARTGQTP